MPPSALRTSTNLCQKGSKPEFNSVYKMRQLVDGLAPGLGETSWRTGDVPFLADKKNRIQKFFYRPLKGVITHFFRQPAFKNYLVYTPEKHYNAKGERIYSDFYTADFFNDEHSKLPPGCTLVPILFASDSTKLADQVGDHNLWPIYMSIGNLPASIRSRPSTNSWILVATLPIPPKQDLQQMQTYLDEDGVEHTHTKSYMEEKYKALKDDAMHNVISILLKDLDRFYERGLRLDCADGKIRNGRPVLAGWIADYQEYNKLCQIKSHGCAVCEIDYKRLGDNILGNPRNHEEDAKRISRLYNKRREALALPNKKGTKAQLARDKKAIAGEIKALERDISRRQLRVRDSSFWHLKNFSLKSLWKPDILHTLYEGMVKHLIQLVTDFLTHHGRLAEFEAAWIRIPPFQDMPAMKRAIGQNTQTTGKLLRKVVRCILPSLVIALKEPPLDKEEDFRRCLTCVRYLVDFVLVCQYKYHTESTIGLLDEYLAGFHKYKDVFSPFRNEESRKNAGQKKFNEVFLQLTVDFARKRGIKVAVKDVNKADEALKPAPTRVEKNSGRKPARGGKAAGSRSSGRGGAKCSANAGKRGTAGSVGAQNGQTDEDTSDNSWSLEDISTLDPKIQNWMRQEFSARGISEEVWDTQIVDVGDFIRTVAEDEREKAMETGGHFNFIKIHLMSHFSDTVRQFGSLEQFSTEIGETLHKLPKEAYRRSNKHEHVPQILVYCTRKYVIRMKELNLVQLAKDGFWQTEIQDALHLYASRADRRQAAKLGRDGKGALSLYRLSREAANESDRTDDDADVEDEISDTEREREIQDDPIRMPPVVPLFAPDVVAEENIHPLFSKPLSTARGRRFFSGRVTGKRMNLEQVAALFEAPTLVEGVRRHLIERHVEYSGFNRAEFGAFRVEVRTAVNIRTRTVQSLEPYETLKARCTGKGTVGTRFGPRNDAVLYRADYLESDDEDAGPEELSAATLTCFKSLSVGKLLSLFRIKLPRITDITTYKTAVGNLPEEMFRYYRLAFLRVLEPIYAGPQGEMLPGPEIARFGLRKPDQLSGFRVVDIKTMVRPAHLIPEHSDDEKDEKKMRWVFNNRIDHGTWDLIYGGSHEGDDEDMMDVS